MTRRVALGVTVGDPAGIGPEIVAKALREGRLTAAGPVVIYAEPETFAAACRDAGVDVPSTLVAVDAGGVPPGFRPGAPSVFGGRVAAAAIEAAARAALAGEIDALVTAPLSKSSLASAGVPHPGHTEYLAALSGASSVAMMFVAGDLRLSLATIHVPLAEVASLLTTDGLLDTLKLTRDVLIERLAIPDPRLAVLGVNPHAGEGGRFGDEEARVVTPAIRAATGRGWRVEGPFPADSFFARHGSDYDAVVAMYHDQGLIPVKLLGGGKAVNVTLGLPFLRTSVDHGTAFDIAGRGIASEESLLEAARLASAWVAAGRDAS